jgi:hypothetical protein
MFGRITRTVSDATVGTVIVLYHVALQAHHERVLARGELAEQRGDRSRLVPHHHVPRAGHDDVARPS